MAGNAGNFNSIDLSMYYVDTSAPTLNTDANISVNLGDYYDENAINHKGNKVDPFHLLIRFNIKKRTN